MEYSAHWHVTCKEQCGAELPRPLFYSERMKTKIIFPSWFAATVVAAIVEGVCASTASAFEGSLMTPMQAGKMSATIVLAEKAFASKASANPNAKRVMLKGYDPVAYFKQNKAVHGNSAMLSRGYLLFRFKIR